MATSVEPSTNVIRTAPTFFANSLLAAALGVTCARVFEQFVVAIAAAINGRAPVLMHSATLLTESGSDLVLLAAPAASLALGLILLMMYPGSKDRSAGRLVMLWTMLFAFRNACVALATTPVDESSPIALALERWNVPSGVDLVLAVFGILGLVLIAIGAAPAFLSFSRHRSEVSTASERLRFAGSIALIPGLAGPLLAVPLFLPDAGTGFVSTLPLAGAFIIVTVLAAAATKSFSPPQIIEERGLVVGLIIAYALAFLVLRLGLEPGLPIPPWDENLQLTLRP
ncbi:MAG: hypothetical protein OEX04_04210 [Acidimicrobiia bacterium]|nr:hypothetical protein [Acidimicrobiia bacterium]MDH4306662.1 hypothetical protein [Acidimicrobiia bacterium]